MAAKEHPILMSTPVVQAQNNGLKSQTRRIVNPQPDFEAYYETRLEKRDCELGIVYDYNQGADNPFIKCPYGNVGDKLWVREASFPVHKYSDAALFRHIDKTYLYKADNEEIGDHKWTPSIHMPRTASRITLEITEIREQRIASISDEDCIAEGIALLKEMTEWTGCPIYKKYVYGPYPDTCWTVEPRDSFTSLWQLINGKPKPMQRRVGDKIVTVGYVVYPFNEEIAAAQWGKQTHYKNKPLLVVPNPVVWAITYKTL